MSSVDHTIAARPAASWRPAPIRAAAQALNTRAIVAGSFALMRRNAVTVLALVAAAAAPERILYHLTGLPLFPVTALSCVVLYAAVHAAAMADLNGQPVRFGACLSAGFAGFRRHFATIAITVAAVWFLAILPGISLARRWALAAPVALSEDLPRRDAFARSKVLTAPHRRPITVLILALAGLAISRAAAMAPIWGMPKSAFLIFLIGNWLMPLLLAAFTAAAGAVLHAAIGATPATPVRAAPPQTIANATPDKAHLTIGFGNLAGPAAAPLLDADCAALSPFFAFLNVPPTGHIPKTPILFLYAGLDADGRVSGFDGGPQKLAAMAGAKLLILATENPPDPVIASGKLNEPAYANVVFTTNRNGDGFALFFRRYFELMLAGQDCLAAYVALAPQGPFQEDWLPGTLLVTGAGKMVFPKADIPL